MHKFLLFCWQDHEASGGMNDLFGRFDAVDEAKAAADQFTPGISDMCRSQIVAAQTLEIVCEGKRRESTSSSGTKKWVWEE